MALENAKLMLAQEQKASLRNDDGATALMPASEMRFTANQARTNGSGTALMFASDHFQQNRLKVANTVPAITSMSPNAAYV
jgi:hypothetical protein